jgi:hypothetical protein
MRPARVEAIAGLRYGDRIWTISEFALGLKVVLWIFAFPLT